MSWGCILWVSSVVGLLFVGPAVRVLHSEEMPVEMLQFMGITTRIVHACPRERVITAGPTNSMHVGNSFSALLYP
ncbi:hypothetical protein DDD64_01945 [Actinotignum sanguinis]|nr:hypothetical protein DDD64_01945 [Actinotignum sanguinis]